jgi:hypothetical protein
MRESAKMELRKYSIVANLPHMHRTPAILGNVLGGVLFAACVWGWLWSSWVLCLAFMGDVACR